MTLRRGQIEAMVRYLAAEALVRDCPTPETCLAFQRQVDLCVAVGLLDRDGEGSIDRRMGQQFAEARAEIARLLASGRIGEPTSGEVEWTG